MTYVHVSKCLISLIAKVSKEKGDCNNLQISRSNPAEANVSPEG